jgi:alpha-ketoglutarate-dependent taurine dioxygenase
VKKTGLSKGSDGAAVLNGSPFDVENATSYARWRDWKLSALEALTDDDLMLEIENPAEPDKATIDSIFANCELANMTLFRTADNRLADRHTFRQFMSALGFRNLRGHLLADDDDISTITPSDRSTVKGEYIPYTGKALNWHTDGYYHEADNPIRSMTLYCARQASSGGESAFLDPDIIYIRLRDQNPDYIRALMRPDAMTVPANTLGGTEIRPARTGPVFMVDPASDKLSMRYTARKVSIEWPEDDQMIAARAALEGLLSDSDGDPMIMRRRLSAGEGIICNNVLHKRSEFEDPDRVLYRGRFSNRVGS